MLKNKLVIITAFFPYGYAEPFLLNEVHYLSQFYDIEIFPLLKSKGNNVLREVPSNIIVHKPLLKRNYILRFLQGIFNCSPILPYFKDLVKLKSSSKNKLKSFNDWILNLISFRVIHSNNRLQKSLNSNKAILYFYWNTMPVKFLSNISNTILIRVHGGELDIERSNGYITLLAEKIVAQPNRIYLPISNAADLSLKKLNPSIHTKISRLGVFDNGVNRDNSKGDDITIVSCSSLIPLKRVHLIVEALSQIKKNKVRWIHFGDGPLYNDIFEKTKNLSSNIKVEFKGQVSNTEIIQFYKNNHIDLFINVSETEGVPVSIMEALSFGIPCFATDVGGTSEIVNNEVGMLVNKNFQPIILANFIIKIQILAVVNNFRQNARKMWFNRCNALKNYEELKLFISQNIDIY